MTSRKPPRRLPAKFLRRLQETLPPDGYDALVGPSVEAWKTGDLEFMDFYDELAKRMKEHVSPDAWERIFSPKKERRP